MVRQEREREYAGMDPMTGAPDLPAVSVVMAVHNGMPYVESAVRSMMDQTLREIEIIVVDDASTDETPQVLARLADEDPRIRILTNTINLKLAASLNRGLEAARAPLIARMDADDLSMPNRLEVQKAYLDAHPAVIMVATSNRQIDSKGRVLSGQRRAFNPVELRWRLRFGMPLVHPSVMFRKQDVDGVIMKYDPNFAVAQDFDLVVRAAEKGDVTSLPDVLVDWRLHSASITATKRARQNEAAEVCTSRVQMRDLSEAQQRELVPFMDIVFGRQKVTVRNAAQSIRVIARLVAADIRAHPRHARSFRKQAVIVLNFIVGDRGIGTMPFSALLVLISPRLFLSAVSVWRDRRNWRKRYGSI